MRVVGIDPGIKTTGYGIVEGRGSAFSLVEAGIVSTRERDDMPTRIRNLYDDILALFKDARADVTAIEKLYAHYAHPRTAILMAHARGAILLAAAQCGVPVASYSPNLIKQSLTGNGHASKSQMQQMIQVMLGLHAPPEPPDVADALAVALCHLNTVDRPAAIGRRRT